MPPASSTGSTSAALGLLCGALTAVAVLRRRPLPIPDRAHAWGYLGLLILAGAAVAMQ